MNKYPEADCYNQSLKNTAKESSLQLVMRELHDLCELLSYTRDVSDKLFPFIVPKPESPVQAIGRGDTTKCVSQYPPVYDEILGQLRRAKYLVETVKDRLIDAEL